MARHWKYCIPGSGRLCRSIRCANPPEAIDCGQIEEHLVGIKGLAIGVETPGEIPTRQRLAVEGQLGPILDRYPAATRRSY